MYTDLFKELDKGRNFRKALEIKSAALDAVYIYKDVVILHFSDIGADFVGPVYALLKSALVLSVYAEIVKLAVLPFRKGAPDLNVFKSL